MKYKNIKSSVEDSKNIHKNVSLGYFIINKDKTRTFVPYSSQELGEVHTFISPSISRKKHMKWTKTRRWKNKEKAKNSKWNYTPTFGGLNTVT